MALVAPSSVTTERIIEPSSSSPPSPAAATVELESSSRRVSDAASDSSPSSSSVPASSTAASLDHDHPVTYSPSHQSTPDSQSPAALRSEEYRQLFRLPPGEVIVQDFNCALQESILFQGHMYVFLHYICFYSNIFGFETKRYTDILPKPPYECALIGLKMRIIQKIISFSEITSISRAKTAGIFPNAIEIAAGERKYFFASFLSRDEAFKLINDLWLEHGSSVKSTMNEQETISEPRTPDNELINIDDVGRSEQDQEFDSTNRNGDVHIPDDGEVPLSIENDIVPVTQPELQDNVQQTSAPVSDTIPSSSGKSLIWKQEDLDAPKVPEYYTKVAEAKFPVGVEDFFNVFFSDDSVNFMESFHKKCGDKDFKCTPWSRHEEYGHVRDVSFQHPIKIYFGAKFGSCRETQKFRVYRNSHLIVETSQEIDDVPYADYFCVQGLWDVVRDSSEPQTSSFLKVYVNVAFLKSTVWKGKIVASTVEECREAYATWISIAHNELKQKKLEKKEEVPAPASSAVQDNQVLPDREPVNKEATRRSHKKIERQAQQITSSRSVNEKVGDVAVGNVECSSSVAFSFRAYLTKLYVALRSQGGLPLLLVIAVVVILLMQLSIVVLLSKPQQVHVVSQPDYMAFGNRVEADRSSEALAWLEKRVHHLKDEMLMVESRLERMRLEHKMLKARMEDLEHLRKKG